MFTRLRKWAKAHIQEAALQNLLLDELSEVEEYVVDDEIRDTESLLYKLKEDHEELKTTRKKRGR